MKMHIALFRGSQDVLTAAIGNPEDGFWMDSFPDIYVRATQAIDVDFPEIPREAQAQAELARLDRQEHEVRMKFAKALADIENSRANWLSLPAPSEA